MKYQWPLKVLAYLALATVLAVPTYAAQRMGISAGTHRIGPKSSAGIPTYCMDYTRDAPTAASRYRHVLTASGTAFVRFGAGSSARLVPLQEALAAEKVRIKGRNLTFDRAMEAVSDPLAASRMSTEERQQMELAKALMAKLTPDEMAELRREFDKMLAGEGDFTGLQFENLTDEPIEVVFKSSTIVGEQDEGLGLLTPSLLDNAGGPGVQERLWKQINKEHQKLLADAGHFKGALGTDDGEAFKTAIAAFQDRMAIEETGAIDAPTEKALQRAGSEQKRVTRYNAKARHYAFVSLEESGTTEKAEFRAFLGSDEEIYRGDSIIEVLRKVNNRFSDDLTCASVYIDMTGFTPERARAMGLTMKRSQDSINARIRARPFDKTAFPLGSQDIVFERGVQLEIQPIEAVKGGPRDGWHMSPFRLSKEGRSTSGSIFARSREILQAFIDKLKKMFAPTTEPQTPADYIHRAKEELMKEQNIKEEDLKIEFGSLEFVEVGRHNGSIFFA